MRPDRIVRVAFDKEGYTSQDLCLIYGDRPISVEDYNRAVAKLGLDLETIQSYCIELLKSCEIYMEIVLGKEGLSAFQWNVGYRTITYTNDVNKYLYRAGECADYDEASKACLFAMNDLTEEEYLEKYFIL